MINEFKIGYYYRYTSNKYINYWNEIMVEILDGRWRKCIYLGPVLSFAHFEGMKKGWFWHESNFRYFEETKYPPRYKIKKLLEEIQ